MAENTADPKAKAGDPSRLTPALRLILGVVLVASMLDLMDGQITNIAAPSIVRELGGGESLIKWLGAAYQLAMGTLLVVGGRLGDRYGKRRLYMIGIVGFVLASAACGLAADPAMIIVARLLQGGFGALLVPQGFSILMATFSREQLRGAFGLFAPILGIASVLGPILGGVIVAGDWFGLGWRPVFLINVVLGALAALIAAKILPHDQSVSRERIDMIGAGLLGASMLALIFGLIQSSTNGWSALSIASLAAGVLLLPLFGYRQSTAPEPLIKASLLKNRGFTAGVVMGLVFFAAQAGFLYVMSLFFQLQLHFSADHAALGLTPAALGFIIASLLTRPLIQKLGRRLIAAGLVVTLIGGLGLWATVLARGTDLTVWLTAPSVLVLGIGMGTCINTLFDVAIGDVEHTEAGSASGSFSAIQQLASAIGSALVTTIYFDVAKSHHGATAMSVTMVVVLAVTALCLLLVWLLPRRAAVEH